MGVLLDEVLAQLDLVTHERAHDLVGERRPRPRSPAGGCARLGSMVVSLSSSQSISPKTLEAAEVLLVVRVLGQERRLGRLVLQVHLLLADLGREQRWLGDVDVARARPAGFICRKKNVSSSVRMWLPSTSASAMADHLVVADLGDVELVADAAADGGDEGLDLDVLEHLVEPGPLDVEDLAPDRAGSPGCADRGRRPRCRRPSHPRR